MKNERIERSECAKLERERRGLDLRLIMKAVARAGWLHAQLAAHAEASKIKSSEFISCCLCSLVIVFPVHGHDDLALVRRVVDMNAKRDLCAAAVDETTRDHARQ